MANIIKEARDGFVPAPFSGDTPAAAAAQNGRALRVRSSRRRHRLAQVTMGRYSCVCIRLFIFPILPVVHIVRNVCLCNARRPSRASVPTEFSSSYSRKAHYWELQ